MDMKHKPHRISKVHPGSIAEEVGIQPGDLLVAIDGQDIVDIIDYLFLSSEEELELEVHRPETDETFIIEIEKEYDEEIGLSFDNPLLDDARHCNNHCVFCFIDQMPPGMRPSLYFKDDDSRLSFMQGNFVTLTNLNAEQIARIIRYRISPINVSVHTTDPELRRKMLGNRHAGDILEKMRMLADGNIEMNAQIVLVPDMNDGEALASTLEDLSGLYPALQSVAIVPVGLSRFREGLAVLSGFDRESARRVIEGVLAFQAGMLERIGTRFAFAADEFFLLSEMHLPDDSAYETYIQLENGVGLMRKFEMELAKAAQTSRVQSGKRFVVATGTLAGPWLTALFSRLGLDHLEVRAIENRYFGTDITVSGLVTASDLMEQIGDLRGKEAVLIPGAMLKADEPVFLDDISLDEVSQRLGIRVIPVTVSGKALINRLEELE